MRATTRALLLCMAGALVIVADGQARTWRVERDGSGDFIVIQDAVDAASAGDSIQIGPGQYPEYRVQPVPAAHIYVDLRYKGELTLIGAGADVTKIGPYVMEGGLQWPNYGIYGAAGVNEVRVRDIGVVNMNSQAVGFRWCHAVVTNCAVTNSYDGVLILDSPGGVVEGCTFSDILGLGEGVSINSSPTVTVRDCVFTNCGVAVGLHWSGSANCVVENCTATGGLFGIQIDEGATAQVSNCRLIGQSVKCMSFLDSGSVQVDDCWFEHGTSQYSDASAWDINCWDVVISGQGNTLISGLKCIYLRGWPHLELQNNHFLRANDQAWYVRVPTPFAHVGGVDLSWNWWGTDDPAEIAAWIYDDQDDPAVHMHVNFEPFLGGPVAAEEMTWGEVKSMFRGAR